MIFTPHYLDTMTCNESYVMASWCLHVYVCTL